MNMFDDTAHTRTAHSRSWFALRYTTQAPAGLPPVIEANHVLRYSDTEGTWLVALWSDTTGAEEVARSILRLPDSHVELVTRHDDMGRAAVAAIATPGQAGVVHP